MEWLKDMKMFFIISENHGKWCEKVHKKSGKLCFSIYWGTNEYPASTENSVILFSYLCLANLFYCGWFLLNSWTCRITFFDAG